MKSRSTWWLASKAAARVILGDRQRRRSFMARLLAVLVAQLAAGTLLFPDWLSQGLWRFSLYWGSCALLCLFLLLLALYDALAVIGEEKKKLGLGDLDKLDEDDS